jgi:hypothetical protein
MGDSVVKTTNTLTTLALALALGAAGMVPLALTVGCDLLKKQPSEEEIRAKIQAEQAEQAEQDRMTKLEEELAEMKEQQAANDAAAKQAKDEQVAALEKQLAAQRQRAAQAAKEAEEAKAAQTAQQAGGPRRGRDTSGGGQQAARMSVVSVPQGTKVAVSISGTLSTDTHKVGDSWEGTLAQAVVADGATIWSAGARAAGVVSASTPAGRLANGQGTLAIKLTEVGGSAIDGGNYAVTGDSKGARNAKVIGTTAALGALAGYLSDKNNKKDHALVGAAAGAAAGTAIAAGSATTVITMTGTVSFSLPTAERVTVRNR